jgi:hypothetical protein
MKESLKTTLLPLYASLLNNIKQTEEIYPFCMQWGSNFPKEWNSGILFVGKATNGWQFPTRDVNEVFLANGNGIFNRNDQMRWVEDVRYYSKSPFWRVIKNTTSNVYEPNHWYNYVAWSNLYKLSYGKGNPNTRLKREQSSLCIDILKEEIRALSPRFVVFLTSGWEDFFFNSIFSEKVPIWNKVTWSDHYQTHFTEHDGITFIRSQHPERKPEKEHVEVLTQIINGVI